MKQVELARKLGISKSYLCMILSGQRTPNPELAERISSQSSQDFKAKLCLEGSRSVRLSYRDTLVNSTPW